MIDLNHIGHRNIEFHIDLGSGCYSGIFAGLWRFVSLLNRIPGSTRVRRKGRWTGNRKM